VFPNGFGASLHCVPAGAAAPLLAVRSSRDPTVIENDLSVNRCRCNKQKSNDNQEKKGSVLGEKTDPEITNSIRLDHFGSSTLYLNVVGRLGITLSL
jgi:hypothetical protein